MQSLVNDWQIWAWSIAILAFAVVLAFIGHQILFFILRGLSRRKDSVFIKSLVSHGQAPSAWILPLLALLVALPATPLPSNVLSPSQRIVGLGLIAVIAWLVILFCQVLSDLAYAHYRVDVEDNLAARRVHTQIKVLRNIVIAVVVIVAFSIMLMTIPAIRQIGVSLLASAGLAGLVVGMAMRGTLSSLIAGIQIAFTQPIRLDDAVFVEGEWGWIEEITTTYIVVRIWDLRRLVLPLSYFIEHPFQNWTRHTADLLGTVILYADYTLPVEEARKELSRILRSSSKWKGNVCVLQVTDATERSLQLRALFDARDSGTAWDLRCEVREKLIQFLQERYPRSLPTIRTEFRSGPQPG